MNKTETYGIEEGRKLLASGVKQEKKKNNHPESKLQQACVKWFRMQYSGMSILLFAIPNGGARSAVEAQIMVGEGITPGVADLMLATSKYRDNEVLHHGFFIEMKAGKKPQSEHQKKFMEMVRYHDYKYEVCRSFDQFRQLITDYLK